MENQPPELENSLPVWDRLRESLERLRAASGRKTDAEARVKKLAARARLVRDQIGVAEPVSVPLYFLAFTRSRERYGIPLEYVLEVQALEQFSPVPGAPAFIRGVVHWRGAILALLDLTRLFEVAEIGLCDLHAYVVVETGGKRLAVAASFVEDIFGVTGDRLKTPPPLPSAIAPECVVGIHDENRLILNMAEIFKYLEQNNNR